MYLFNVAASLIVKGKGQEMVVHRTKYQTGYGLTIDKPM